MNDSNEQIIFDLNSTLTDPNVLVRKLKNGHVEMHERLELNEMDGDMLQLSHIDHFAEILMDLNIREADKTSLKEIDEPAFSIHVKSTDVVIELNSAALNELKKYHVDFPGEEIPAQSFIADKDIAIANLNWNINNRKFELGYSDEVSGYSMNDKDQPVKALVITVPPAMFVDEDLQELGLHNAVMRRQDALENDKAFTMKDTTIGIQITIGAEGIKHLMDQGVDFSANLYFQGKNLFEQQFGDSFKPVDLSVASEDRVGESKGLPESRSWAERVLRKIERDIAKDDDLEFSR